MSRGGKPRLSCAFPPPASSPCASLFPPPGGDHRPEICPDSPGQMATLGARRLSPRRDATRPSTVIMVSSTDRRSVAGSSTHKNDATGNGRPAPLLAEPRYGAAPQPYGESLPLSLSLSLSLFLFLSLSSRSLGCS